MTKTTVKWYGKDVSAKFDKSLLAGITASAITLEREIVRNIDDMNIIDTGRYKGSITYRSYTGQSSPTKSGDGVQSVPQRYEAFVGTNVDYARPLEFGHTLRNGKWVKERPAIRKAADEKKKEVLSAFVRTFAKVFV